MSRTTHTLRCKTLKKDICKHRQVEKESLLRWFAELDDAIKARCIVDDLMQVSFAE